MLLDFIQLGETKELYKNIYNGIKQAVNKGIIKKGEKLPSVREAAAQLGVSRTTVENAYAKLCLEGIAESEPQRGYFVSLGYTPVKRPQGVVFEKPKIKYDFSSRNIDTKYADTKNWKKTVRQVLINNDELTSYGDAQGEFILREALSDYSFKSRGLSATASNIVIGAGIGPLLNILLGITGRKLKVGFEMSGFLKAQSIFADYGIETVVLESDSNGATLKSIKTNKIDVLFLTTSSLPKISISGIAKRRSEYISWLQESQNRFIIEDDYNGELRYTIRSLPAFQGKAAEKTVYIGSFSKLLLPSVRIAYMVLPDDFLQIFNARRQLINQTCGKIEQLALAEYIKSGNLEKHLRRLRRLYYMKSQILTRELESNFNDISITLYESLLTVEIQFNNSLLNEDLYNKLLRCGILTVSTERKDCIRLCFAGIEADEIENAVKAIKRCVR